MRELETDRAAYWHRDRHLGANERATRIARKRVVILVLDEKGDLLADDRWFPIFALDLPISTALRKRLEDRRMEYQDILAPKARAKASRKSLHEFIRESADFAGALKVELPEWTIAIGDFHGILKAPGGGFCPEVLAGGKLGPCPIFGLQDLQASTALQYLFDPQELRNRIRCAPPRICIEYQLKYANAKPRWWHDNISDEEIDRQETVFARCELTVFAEYATDGLVDCNFDELHRQYLPISESLQQQIVAWIDNLDEFDRTQTEAGEAIDWQPFAEQGYHLSVALKQALPGWTIHYADRLLIYQAPDGGYCPEIRADGSLGPCRLEFFRNRKVKDLLPSFVWPLSQS